ncbi:hypothetical protein MPER_08615, partial [Moniliophthora perniciosa FA553]
NFVFAAKHMQTNKRPLLFEVIQHMDTLNEILEDWARDPAKPAVIRYGAAKGLAVLDKYYSKTDDSIMYRASMILHPLYKTSYFEKAAWPQEWVTAAMNVVRQLWVARYKPKANATTSTTTSENSEIDEQDPFAKKRKRRVVQTSGDALDDWLDSVPEDSDAAEDPLQWWTEDYTKLRNWCPELQRMALDILSCPATSADVERFFSRGGLMVTKHRYALSDESTRAGTILFYWSNIPGLLPEAELAKALGDKSKRIE